jgi:hypothetical protein
MILLTVDDWIPLDQFDVYEIIAFKFVLVVSPGEEKPNVDDALFGMSYWEPFKRMKAGIAYYCGVDKDDICVYWNSNALLDEDTPEFVGMEDSIFEEEELEIHFAAKKIEV